MATNHIVEMSYKIKDYMDKEFPIVDSNATAFDAAEILSKTEHGYIIVLDKGKPVGILTERDLVTKVIANKTNPGEISVSSIMSSPLISIDPDEDLMKASELMVKKGIRRLAVMKNDIIYGVITSQIIASRCGDYVEKSVRDIIRWSIPPY